jgi:acyl-CoA thioester hydrolase
VRTYDIDSIGHVSNIVYIRWLEDLRLELFDKHFGFASVLAAGWSIVLIETQIEYKRAIKLADRVQAKMWISSLGKATINLAAEFFANEILTTKASHKAAFVDLKTTKPIRVPQVVLDRCKCLDESKGVEKL